MIEYMKTVDLNTEARLQSVLISPQVAISEAINILDQSGLGVLLVADENQKLLGLITDGDIRRAMIHGISFSEACETISNKAPIVAPESISPEEALNIMDHAKAFLVNHLPLIDGNNRITGLLLRSDLTPKHELGLRAVVMAGGFGTRLRPLTEDLPKPMLPVGEKPLLETVICQLRDVGVKQVNVTTHYKPEKIRDYFGNGDKFGINISYVNEDQPLGTAGALALMSPPDEPCLVINGDVLTKVNFRAMFEFHKENLADITIGVRRYEMQCPYGVIMCNGVEVASLEEKPFVQFIVNAGIYLLDPEVFKFIPKNRSFHMTDLIKLLLKNKRKVVSFAIHEYWKDIGHHSDYDHANADFIRQFRVSH